MPDWGGGLFTAFMAAKDVGKDEGKGAGGGGVSSSGGGGTPPDPGGYYEETVFGGKTWHSTNGEPDLHGQEAVDKADEVFGGPPTDGITGEKGYYGDWKPSGGGGQQPQQGGGWGRGRGFGK